MAAMPIGYAYFISSIRSADTDAAMQGYLSVRSDSERSTASRRGGEGDFRVRSMPESSAKDGDTHGSTALII